jgi:hypothetical protein
MPNFDKIPPVAAPPPPQLHELCQKVDAVQYFVMAFNNWKRRIFKANICNDDTAEMAQSV